MYMYMYMYNVHVHVYISKATNKKRSVRERRMNIILLKVERLIPSDPSMKCCRSGPSEFLGPYNIKRYSI